MDFEQNSLAAELHLLVSMYSGQELQFADQALLDRLLLDVATTTVSAADVSTTSGDDSSAIEFRLFLTFDDVALLELTFYLPSNYPASSAPTVFARSSAFSNATTSNIFNADLRKSIGSLPLGAPMITDIIDWAQSNYLTYTTAGKEGEKGSKKDEGLSSSLTSASTSSSCLLKLDRLWIYSHHIYSKFKRKNLISLAEDLELTGFSFPGKPGVICVEGESAVCDQYWSQIRLWSWQKLTLRYQETAEFAVSTAASNISNKTKERWRKFDDFQEVFFDDRMRGLQSFLRQHECAEAFQWLFGLADSNE